MHRKKKGQASSPALPATEQELGVMPVANREIQGTTNLATKIRFNLRPICMRTQSAVQLFEQRHNRIKLFSQNLISHRLGARVNLASGFNGLLCCYKLGGFLVIALPQRRNSCLQSFHPVDCVGGFKYRKGPL